MKSPFFCALTLLFIVTPNLVAHGEELANTPQTLQEKEGYSIGYQIARGMKLDGADLDLDFLIQGILDGNNDKQPLLDPSEMKSHIIDVKKRAREVRLMKVQEIIVKNAEESKKFLEKNAQREGVKTTESGLQYIVLKEGEGASPTLEDNVTVHYRGTFPNGTEFDNSYAKGKPQTFQTDGVIKGWTEALQMMKEKAKWQIFLPPELAYGRSGLDPTIPPNQVLVFEMELLSVDKKNLPSPGGQKGG